MTCQERARLRTNGTMNTRVVTVVGWTMLALIGACRFEHLAGEGIAIDGAAAAPGGPAPDGGSLGAAGAGALPPGSDANPATAGSGGSTLEEDVVPLGGPAVGWPIQLTGDQVATRLASLLWNAAPDEALRRFVASRAPATNVDVGAIADAMLVDARAESVIPRFYDWWMGLAQVEALTKDTTLAPWFTPAVAKAMRAQVHAFASAITWAPDGSLARLLTDTQAPVPELLLPAFRGAASGSGPVRTLEPTAYAGIWSLPAPNAIAASARFESPVRRGAAIQARLLCMALPLAPPGVGAVEPTSLDETTTMREMLAQHSVASTCAGCHKFMDPVGFAFSQFDAAGGFRVDDVDGQPVDDSGTLEWGSGEAAVPFIGAPELMKIVAPVERTQRCFAAHWLGFALGRAVKDVPEMDFVDPAASYVRKRAQISGQLNLRGLLRAVVETKPFLAP